MSRDFLFFQLLLGLLLYIGSGCGGGQLSALDEPIVDGGGTAGGDGDTDWETDTTPDGDAEMVVVTSEAIDDILYNPGLGFTDSHFSWGNPANPPAYPDPSVYPPSTAAGKLKIPADLSPGVDALDVVLVSADGDRAELQLAIDGRRADGWYALSEVMPLSA